jgi:ornithine--oxo-acid transaminase
MGGVPDPGASGGDGGERGWLGALVERSRPRALELHAAAINPQFVRVLRTIGFDREWARAAGAYLYDAGGRRYLDTLGGYGMFNVGRNHPRVREALLEALAMETPGSVQLGVSALPALLAGELLRRAPRRLRRVLFTSSGTESVEAAIKLARAATARPRVLFAGDAFHGLTLGALSACGRGEFTSPFGPLVPGFARVAFNDLDALELELRREDVALFLVEPIQGKVVGMPASGYLAGAQALCRRYGALFCVDEVQTGLGRTGRMFALEHWGLEPDLLTLAKSLSGGYVPSGACLMSEWVYERVFDRMENAVRHGSTFAPNDLAMAAGLATLRVLEDEGLVENARRLGGLLSERTRGLADRYEIVRGTRGLGLLWGIEFGEPRRGRATWRLVERAQPGLFAQFVVGPLFHDHRVLSQVSAHGENIIKILPPLTLTESDLEWFAAALERVVADGVRVPRAAARFVGGVVSRRLGRASSGGT